MKKLEQRWCVYGIVTISVVSGVFSLGFHQATVSCVSTSQISSSSCAQGSILRSHYLVRRGGTALEYQKSHLNRSDRVRNEISDRYLRNSQSDRCYPDDQSVNVPSKRNIADTAGGLKKLSMAAVTFCMGVVIFGTSALFPDVCMALSNQQDAVSSTANVNNMPKWTSRYWSMMGSNDQSQIMAANENLMDQAVGTINTMYYDNSGGADFSPKDVYDRWKVLRTYAKEGGAGVKAINNNEAQKQQKRATKEDLLQQQLATQREPPFYGNGFSSQLFSVEGDSVKLISRSPNKEYDADDVGERNVPSHAFDSREKAVASLKWLVSTLCDPYSKYLTREELQGELQVRDSSFLGLGAIVEPPPRTQEKSTKIINEGKGLLFGQENVSPQSKNLSKTSTSLSSTASVLTSTRVMNLPIVTAIVPDSPAERAGIVVGDRFAAIGTDKLVGLGRDEVVRKLSKVYTGADNYVGYPDVTIAKPILRSLNTNSDEDTMKIDGHDGFSRRAQIEEYKLSRVRLPTMLVEPFKPYTPSSVLPQISESTSQPASGGDSIVHYELLTPDDSIFRRSSTLAQDKNYGNGDNSNNGDSIGYIRITRFSRLATEGYIKAVNELEKAGAKSYIIDVRNNYGGVIQESMLTAASLLRDPHAVLCYTMNSRGGFTPHDSEEYIVDKRYPGYLLSSEKPSVTLQQVKRDNPEFVNEDGTLKWYPPSSYASLREQRVKRGIRPASGIAPANAFELDSIISSRQKFKRIREERKQMFAQKNIVLLINEGTASAAEVFVSSLHDNGRTVATVGTRTYGKGLIQHTFPMPDGGGLRLTVAEYLTPSLQHVTKVGNARYDSLNGDVIRGGISPDIYCSSKQGIPSNAGADFCVGLALDALEDADIKTAKESLLSNTVHNKLDFRSTPRRIVTQGITKDTY